MKIICKKILVLILICTVNICAISSMSALTLAEEKKTNSTSKTKKYPFGYSNPDCFVSDAILGKATDENDKKLGFTSIASNPIIWQYTYRIIAEGIIDKQWLTGSSVFWKNAENCLNGDFVDLFTWKQVMYETLIMDWLTYQFESNEFQSEFQKSSEKYAWKIIQYLMDDIDVYSEDGLGNMSVEDAERLLDDEFYKNNELLGKASDFNNALSDIVKVANTGKDFYEQFSKVLAAKEACYSRIEFLEKVKEITTDKDLCNAIDTVIDKLNMSAINIAFNEGGYVMLKTICDEAWDLLVEELQLPSLAAIELGQDGLDWIFNSSKSSTKRIELVILYIINSDFMATYQKLRDAYANNPTAENAVIYNNAFLDYVLYQAYASNITQKYIVEALLEGAGNQFFNSFSKSNINKYNDLKEMLDSDIRVCKAWCSQVGMRYNLYNNALAENNNIQWDFDNEISNVTDIPDNAVEFNGHYYYLYNENETNTYDEALQYCKDKNGYLATITSNEENDFLFNYMTQQGYHSAYFGLRDNGEKGTWKWCNGEEVTYTNWCQGDSNNGKTDVVTGNENYAMFCEKNTDGTWDNGDFGNETENGGKAFICEWGDYSLQENQHTREPIKSISTVRDIVLVLDVSGSMAGAPLNETKKASINFVETILGKEAGIGIVTYDSSAQRVSDFSVDKGSLKNEITGICDGGGTNIESGLTEAQSMLSTSNAKKKIIVLMSDGEPNEGKEGDELIQYADKIKNDGTLIYTLGFFESIGDGKSSAQLLMEKIASDGCHYEVANADDLIYFFEDMADQINGQKYIYVRIACPVDVSVTYDGQTLDSSESNQSFRTDFGTLTFEENDEEEDKDLSSGNDNRIKVLRLKAGTDYDLKIVGTGHGLMNYTIGFMNDDGDYSDFRRFENIKITKRTVIDTVAKTSEESVLNIDENGDGKYDLKLRAGENGYGEEIEQGKWIYLAIGGSVIFTLFLFVIVVKKLSERKRKVNS